MFWRQASSRVGQQRMQMDRLLLLSQLARMKCGTSFRYFSAAFATGRGACAFAVIALLSCSQQLVTGAMAGPREDAAAAMKRCDALADNKAWLDCHDAATTQMRTAIQATPGAPVARPQMPQQFGQEDLRSPRPNPASRGQIKRLTARVANFSFSPTGYFTVALDNGQVWRQVDGDTNYARFRMPASRNLVNIEHGFLRSYNLHIQGASEGYKVHRVQ
jgi:hypothetical protein